MIKEFEAGKKYICNLTERPDDWNPDGEMDFLLDGKPHLCVRAKRTDDVIFASFEDDGKTWNFWRDNNHFTEYIEESNREGN